MQLSYSHPGMLYGKTHTLLSGKALFYYYYFLKDC